MFAHERPGLKNVSGKQHSITLAPKKAGVQPGHPRIILHHQNQRSTIHIHTRALPQNQ
jgi:hypothetical protein